MKRLQIFRSFLALFLLLIPIILVLFTGEIRKSISDYAYANYCVLLPILLTISSSLFIIDNVLDKHKWYNTILGIALLGVAMTPHNEYTILHFSFAGIFFIGSAITMIVFSSKKQRWFKIIMATIIIIALSSSIFLKKFSYFYGEWIALLPISIHYIGESLKKFD